VPGLPPKWERVPLCCYFQNWFYNKIQQGWWLGKAGEGKGRGKRKVLLALIKGTIFGHGQAKENTF
jgi:hypothetical protein